MKKIISLASASLLTFFAVNGSFSAYAAAGKDISSLNLSATLKQTEFTYSGAFIHPEYLLSGQSDWMQGEYQTADYRICYRYSLDAGTGKLIAVGMGDYTGEQTLATYTIKPLDIKDVEKLSLSIGAAEYTGKPTFPCLDIYNGRRKLKESVDYTVSASDNVELGMAGGSINFCGNYTGSIPIGFRIVHSPINHFTAEATSSGIVLKWDKVNCDEINIYRYDSQTNKMENIGSTKDGEYTDTDVTQLKEYSYSVQTTTTYNGRKYYSNSSSRTVTTLMRAPKLETNTDNGKVTLMWDANHMAAGYMVYMDNNILAQVFGSDNTAYTVSGISPSDNHLFRVAAYMTTDGKTRFGPQSNEVNCLAKQEQSVLRNAKKTDSRTFAVTNVQKQTTTSGGTVTLSENDIAILDKFAKEHFTDSMTDTEKLQYTLTWINRNTNYAYTTTDWNKISRRSYVDAIFNIKTGQCMQYNGAMVSMMRYLGYDADLVLGWRGSWPGNYWQHYWGEIEIDGTKYVIEAGNYGKSGSWSYFLVPYDRTDKYIVNCKNM